MGGGKAAACVAFLVMLAAGAVRGGTTGSRTGMHEADGGMGRIHTLEKGLAHMEEALVQVTWRQMPPPCPPLPTICLMHPRP
jgi:hypothetical protein